VGERGANRPAFNKNTAGVVASMTTSLVADKRQQKPPLPPKKLSPHLTTNAIASHQRSKSDIAWLTVKQPNAQDASPPYELLKPTTPLARSQSQPSSKPLLGTILQAKFYKLRKINKPKPDSKALTESMHSSETHLHNNISPRTSTAVHSGKRPPSSPLSSRMIMTTKHARIPSLNSTSVPTKYLSNVSKHDLGLESTPSFEVHPETIGIRPRINQRRNSVTSYMAWDTEDKADTDDHLQLNTIWDAINKDTHWSQGIKVNIDEFHSLFQNNAKHESAINTPIRQPPRVLDDKRVKQAELVISRITLTSKVIITAIQQLDDRTLTASQIRDLISVAPTQREQHRLLMYNLDNNNSPIVNECELIMLELAQIEEPREFLEALLFMKQFPIRFSEIRSGKQENCFTQNDADADDDDASTTHKRSLTPVLVCSLLYLFACLVSFSQQHHIHHQQPPPPQTPSTISTTTDARLVQESCNEVKSAIRLRKVLGLIMILSNEAHDSQLGNDILERALSISSLLMLSHVKSLDGETTLLHYIAKTLRDNDAKLLRFREDLPSLFLAAKVNWSDLTAELEQTEAKLTHIKRLVIARGADQLESQLIKHQQARFSPKDELKLLESSPSGRFVLEACLKMNILYEDLNVARLTGDAVLQYFGEDQSDMSVSEFLRALHLFCNDFDDAVRHVKQEEEDRYESM
jgi:Formin Homology 2 Domain